VIERGIERGTDNNVLSTLQLWGAGLTVVPLLIGSAFWLTGSYRAESLDPSILQLFYDMPWLLINLACAVTTVQMCAMGVAFLKDKRETPCTLAGCRGSASSSEYRSRSSSSSRISRPGRSPARV